MQRLVLLLRAVNVGGTNILPMARLRGLLGELGYERVSTWLQSGNAVLSTAEAPELVARRVEDALVAIDIHAPVIVRTVPELQAVLQQRPAAADDPITGKQHLVGFFDHEPSAEPDLARFAPETAHRVGRELLLHHPNGAGKARLTLAILEKAYGARLTTRNWVTVRALLDLGE